MGCKQTKPNESRSHPPPTPHPNAGKPNTPHKHRTFDEESAKSSHQEKGEKIEKVEVEEEEEVKRWRHNDRKELPGTFFIKEDDYERYKEGKRWVSLPKSVIGTLIYFLVIEHNHEETPDLAFLLHLFLIGLPVYITYIFQATILYEIWVSSGDFVGDDDGVSSIGLCAMDIYFEIATISCFLTALLPSLYDVIHESCIVLFCEEVCLNEPDDKYKEIGIHKVFSTPAKRIVTWILVCLAEMIILSSIVFVGIKFILTSNGVANVVIDSVGIVFVLDIDNMAREAFQSELVSEHIDRWEFNTTVDIDSETQDYFKGEDIAGEVSKEFPLKKFWSFSSLKEAFFPILLATFSVVYLRSFCG